MSQCRSCHAPVVFVPSAATGRPMILDIEPVADGNVQIMDGEAFVLREGPLKDARAHGTPLRKSHHATCPDADKWRRGRARVTR